MVNHKEETYLQQVYEEMLAKEVELADYLDQSKQSGLSALQEMQKDVRLNFDNISDNLDTFAQLEMKNREIDQMNIKMQTAEQELSQVRRSLESPYFGKVAVDFLDDDEEDFYIGVNGFRNLTGDTRVYDWRSPIAELFYNNELGRSSYQVDTRQIEVDIRTRRQFIIERDHLIKYFDTSVAIQDDVLLEALENDTSGFMKDITATIQKEQNKIIRDTASRHILVNGIAGSGKTSTIMQRIAYLLYSMRQKITSDDILILSPNTQFIDYIGNVLPALGERNPWNLTMRAFVEEYGNWPVETESDYFQRLNEAESDYMHVLRSAEFIAYIKKSDALLQDIPDLFQSIDYKGKPLISVEFLEQLYQATPNHPKMIDKIQAMKKQLISYWEQRIIRQSRSSKIHDQLLGLSEDMQMRYFGELISDESAESLFYYSKKLLKKKYHRITRALAENQWLKTEKLFEKIYQTFTDQPLPKTTRATLDEAVIRLLIQHLFVEAIEVPQLRFILIDEVQDYTYAQLSLLLALFPRAQFTMVGDENQAIFNSQIPFADIQQLFDKNQLPLTRYDLLNSYRSSGAITKLFRQLVTVPMEIVPIRSDGAPVVYQKTPNKEDFRRFVEGLLTDEKIHQLTILTKTEAQAVDLRTAFEDLLTEKIQILSLSLSKGLEFDQVLLYDVSPENYHSDQDQKRLYTAISRGMQELFITYKEELSPLLD